MERVARLVHERLVVGEAALRERDQVHDVRRVGGDDAGARILLRPVLEIETDVRDRGEVEAERGGRLQADRCRAFLRVRRLERREAPDVGDMTARRHRVASGAEDPVEPALPHDRVRLGRRVRGGDERALEVAKRDPLLLLGPRNGVGLPADGCVELLDGGEQLESIRIELRGLRPLEVAELFAVGVLLEDRQARLRSAQRHLLALECDSRGDERVLERVLLVGELGGDDPALARLAQAVEALAIVALRIALRLVERLELCAREQVVVAGDDGRLLRNLLLSDANRAALLGALVVVVAQARLVFGWGANGGRRHRAQPSERRAGGRSSRAPRS